MGATSSVNRSAFVRETVHDNCVVIFSTTTCGYCRMAKDVFNKMGINYKVIELNQLADGGEIMQALRPITNMSTVPQVFVNGACIGGGTETKQLYASGKLLELVQQCTQCSS